MFGALSAILEAVDGGIGSTGGHLRELYADRSMRRAALAIAALGVRRSPGGRSPTCGRTADAAVPADLEGAVDAVEAVEALHEAAWPANRDVPGWRSQRRRLGDPALRRRVPACARPCRGDVPDLGDRLSAIYGAEVDALDVTARAIGR